MAQPPKTYYQSEIERVYNEVPLRPEQYQQVRRSKVFMQQHYADKIELDDLAAAALMSRSHYARVFQRIYGLTPRHYLRDLRISQAKQLIAAGLPITQVCFEVGYESLPTFSNAFKKCTGHSPREYQQLQKSNLE